MPASMQPPRPVSKLGYLPGVRWDQPRGRPRKSAVIARVNARRLRTDTA
jgi:hypothetical protein